MNRPFSSNIPKPVVQNSPLKNQHWETVLNEFLQVKKAEGRAPSTLEDFKGRITRFFQKYPDAWSDERKHRDCLLDYLDRGIVEAIYKSD